MSLSGKVALVTGGSRGIGRATAIALASDGADIIINYLRNRKAAEEVAKRIRRLGRRVLLVQRNVGNPDDIKGIFQDVRRTFGHLDILVHCAALGIFKPLRELNHLQLRRVLDMNAVSFVRCAQEASRLMPRTGGAIVGLSSLGSQRFINGYGGMGMAKACLEAAVRYLAVEFGSKRIRVNGVSGGPVETIGIKAFPNYKRGRLESVRLTPAGRLAIPRDIANVVLFLCKKESDWIRGQTIIADGGLSLRVVSV